MQLRFQSHVDPKGLLRSSHHHEAPHPRIRVEGELQRSHEEHHRSQSPVRHHVDGWAPPRRGCCFVGKPVALAQQRLTVLLEARWLVRHKCDSKDL